MESLEVRASESLRSLHDDPISAIVLFLYVFKIHIIKIANYPRKKLAVTSYFLVILRGFLRIYTIHLLGFIKIQCNSGLQRENSEST